MLSCHFYFFIFLRLLINSSNFCFRLERIFNFSWGVRVWFVVIFFV